MMIGVENKEWNFKNSNPESLKFFNFLNYSNIFNGSRVCFATRMVAKL